MKWSIKPARLHDLPGILERWQELMALHQTFDPVLYALEPHAVGTYQAFIRRQMGARDAVVLVARTEHGEVAGYVVAGRGKRAPMFRIQQVGMIFDMAVKAELRRSGIGRALADEAGAFFTRIGLSYAQVNFSPNNPSAAAFWPKYGFETLLVEGYKLLD